MYVTSRDNHGQYPSIARSTLLMSRPTRHVHDSLPSSQLSMDVFVQYKRFDESSSPAKVCLTPLVMRCADCADGYHLVASCS